MRACPCKSIVGKDAFKMPLQVDCRHGGVQKRSDNANVWHNRPSVLQVPITRPIFAVGVPL